MAQQATLMSFLAAKPAKELLHGLSGRVNDMPQRDWGHVAALVLWHGDVAVIFPKPEKTPDRCATTNPVRSNARRASV
jgi:hypothetical protein